MAMRKIKVGDTVKVLTGKCKGQTGRVMKVLSKGDLPQKERLLVEGVNMVKKHVRGNPDKGIQGGIQEREASIHVSNVALLNPNDDKASRVGFKFLEDGTKVRYFKSNGEVVDI